MLKGDIKSLARSISLVENEINGYEEMLRLLPATSPALITGITGPPGAGKSTITDALIGEYLKENKRVAVLCVDPSSPFHLGALLGDRIRMSEWYNHPSVFIRSVASRGSVGGLNPRIIEITSLLQSAGYDHIIIETVGVGQSEIEISGIANTTVVVLVPEAGDEIQTMKSGLMEIADIFVVNKADRPGSDKLINILRAMLSTRPSFHQHTIPIIATVATEKKGMKELVDAIRSQAKKQKDPDRKFEMLAEKAYQLISKRRMRDITREKLKASIKEIYTGDFNLYRFISEF